MNGDSPVRACYTTIFSRGWRFLIADALILVEGIIFFASNQYLGFEVNVIYDQGLFSAGLDYTVPHQKSVRSWRDFRVFTSTNFTSTLLSFNHTMPRRPLREIDPNRVSGNELSSRIQNRMAGAAACRVASSTISKAFKIPESMIRKTVTLDPLQ
jgi:hypothetical protein